MIVGVVQPVCHPLAGRSLTARASKSYGGRTAYLVGK